MDFDNSISESDEDEEEFPPLPSDIETTTYINAREPYDNRHHTIDLFYCPSPPFPSPPPPLSPPPRSLLPPTGSMIRTYANLHTFASIRNHEARSQPHVSFATQYKKKLRAPLVSLLDSVYINMPRPPVKSVTIANEVTYATLLNTTSLMPTSICSDASTNYAEYQQIQIPPVVEALFPHGCYENVKARRPPPLPCHSPTNVEQSVPSPSESTQSSPSGSKMDSDVPVPSSRAHIYINLEQQHDQPPVVPTRSSKAAAVTMPTPPPVIPRRKEPKGGAASSPPPVTAPSPEKGSEEVELQSLGTSSNASTIQTVKEFAVNPTPSRDDKSDAYRTKLPNTTENLPPVVNARQRRTLHSIRRRRLRGSVALRGSTRGSTSASVNRPQSTRPASNTSVRHPMVTDDRWRRTLRKRRRQRVLQMKLDGNVFSQRTRSNRPISEHTYNEIRQPSSRSRPSPQQGPAGGVLERAMQFNGALRDRVFSWYRGGNQGGREQQSASPKVLSTSDNEESDQKETAVNEDEAEEEFFTHDTFEDFLLRRRPKSSASTTASGSSTVVSQVESSSHRIPMRAPSRQKPQIPPPPPPPPLPTTPPPVRRLPGLALGLDKTDVDFIHNILQRTRGEHRVWNRITALKEAYIRATSKKNDLPKKCKVVPTNASPTDEKKKKKAMTMKHSLAATKIRAELEKYDELPASSATIVDDDDYYDDTGSVNNHRRLHSSAHHRSAPSLPNTPSTTHRLLNFVTAIKRRAQNNVHQLQRNLHDIRSRVHHESMTIPPYSNDQQRHPSLPSRQRPPCKDPSRVHPSRTAAAAAAGTLNGNALVRRTNSHRSATSIEPSNVPHQRRMLNRTQSNTSQMLAQPRQTLRQHSRGGGHEAMASGIARSTSLINRPPPFERRPSHQLANENNIQQRRTKKTS